MIFSILIDFELDILFESKWILTVDQHCVKSQQVAKRYFRCENQRLRSLSLRAPNGHGIQPTFPYKKACTPSNEYRKMKPVSRLMREVSNILVSHIGWAVGG